jgi:hypothetical protein
MRKNKQIKAINTFSVKFDQENAQVRLDWNGKAETLKEAIDVMESVLCVPENVLKEVRKLKPIVVVNNKMITKTFSLV